MNNPTLFQALHWKFQDNGLVVCGKTLNNLFVFYRVVDFALILYIKFSSKFNPNEIQQIRNELLRKGATETKWTAKFPFENNMVINPEGDVFRKKIRVLQVECSNTRAFYSVKNHVEDLDTVELYNDKIKPIVQFFTEQSTFKPCGWYTLCSSLVHSKNKTIVRNGMDVGVNERSRANIYLKSMDIQLQAPLRICSYDLETRGTDENNHPIYQVGMVWWTFFDPNNEKNEKKVLINVGPCLPIPGTDVVVCKSEKELLINFILSLTNNPVDFLIGFNIYKFDNLFIKTRCAVNGISSYLLRLHRDSFRHDLKDFFVEKSSGKGEQYNTIHDFKITGVICVDLRPVAIKEDANTLQSYSLNAVSAKYLGEQKIDLNYKEMERLVEEGKAEGFHKIGVYCIQDCFLPLKLLDKMNVLLYQINYSNLTSFPLDMIFSYGETAKLYSMIYIEGVKAGFIFKANVPIAESSFQGATVLEPIPGFYEKVMVLDFKSLYPTTIISNCLCPSNIFKVKPSKDLLKKAIEKENVKVIKADGVVVYVSKLKGVIPGILEKLLEARDNLKRDMKQHTKGTFLYKLFDAKQRAMKVSANTLYGVFGAGFGELQCLELSRATTSLGRKMIKKTVDFCHSEGRNKYGPDLQVIYGDSVPNWSLITLFLGVKSNPQILTCEQLWNFVQQKRQEVLMNALSPLSPQQILNSYTKKVEPMMSEGKEIFFCSDLDIFTWTSTGRTRINCVIRHAPRVKKMFRITTRGGIIEVTPDHSILQRIGGEIKVVKPSTLKVGDRLVTNKFN